MNRGSSSRPQTQRGVALAVVLILLLVMTLLGLASLRGTLMEERMSANQVDRSLSFQAAEAALREGEAVAAGKPTLPGGGVVGSGCLNGLCAKPDPAVVTPVWQDPTVWASAPSAVVNLGNKTATPKYIVELLADDVPPHGSCTTSGDVSPDAECSGTERRYRITARSDAADRAQVMLQSIYAVP
nr:PilX N-terminal domain-containing pilus assembly protein [Lysobacter profundi]